MCCGVNNLNTNEKKAHRTGQYGRDSYYIWPLLSAVTLSSTSGQHEPRSIRILPVRQTIFPLFRPSPGLSKVCDTHFESRILKINGKARPEQQNGASRVPRHLRSCVPRSLTPTGPPGSHHIDPFVLASGSVTPSPPALAVTRLNCFGECGLPCGPQDSLCTLRMHCSAIQYVAQSSHPLEGVASICLTTSFAYATLNTGSWLGLTRQGLSPCKRCRAWPGALPMRFRTCKIAGGRSFLKKAPSLACLGPRSGGPTSAKTFNIRVITKTVAVGIVNRQV